MSVRADASLSFRSSGTGAVAGDCAAIAGTVDRMTMPGSTAVAKRAMPISLPAWRCTRRPAAAFLDRVVAIDGKIRPHFFQAIWPAYFDAFDCSRAAETEERTQIVLRVVAAAAADFLPL